jgi:hypothetical protein
MCAARYCPYKGHLAIDSCDISRGMFTPSGLSKAFEDRKEQWKFLYNLKYLNREGLSIRTHANLRLSQIKGQD